MSKQDIIREGIKDIYSRHLELGYEGQFLNDDDVVGMVMEYLHDNDVVLEVVDDDGNIWIESLIATESLVEG